ncbi:hypothetical protein [Streptomyces sp. enrichment culture]|uniref:hypothetical protein n=1 Tax=Streptomyces sp. enrichment culture TaxID=1795815 RepID=UPI003F57458B
MRRTGGNGGGPADVEEMLDELYGLPPSAFVPRREELAAAARSAGRADDARRLRAARRPPLGAWAANLLRRSRPQEAERFLELGRALREAYTGLDAGSMKELSAQRRRLVTQLTRQAAGLARDAGHPLSDAVQRDVETTLHAVLADAEAADRWATGRLEKTLTPPSEFPSGAGGTAPAVRERPETAERSAPRASKQAASRRTDELAERRRERQQRLERARAEAEAAEERLGGRRTERAEAEEVLRTARERERAAGEDVTRAERDLARAEEQLRSAREDMTRAEGIRQEAEDRDRSAADALERAERAAKDAAREVERLSRRTR